MNKTYQDILNNLHEESTLEPLHLNSRVLLIDSMNTFLRSFAMIPAINPQGNHIGGLVGFMKSLGYAIKLIQPTRVILVFDGQGNITNRRNTYSEYKANRQIKRITNFNVFSTLEEESDSVATQMMRLLDYLKTLPVNISIIDKIEADDTIAYLSQKLKDDVIIYSADQDFLQLVDERVTVYSPIKKKFYRPNDVYEQYGLYPYNFITMKCLMGDKSDNLPGVKGLGPKKLMKFFPEIGGKEKFTLQEAYQKATDKVDEHGIYGNVHLFKNQLEINYELMCLEEIELVEADQQELDELIKTNPYNFNKAKFLGMYEKDLLGRGIPNTEFWLSEVFSYLQNHKVKI
jgi:DNA polymerase-1